MLRLLGKLSYKFTATTQYTSVDHSLLKQLFTYTYREHYQGYLMVDHMTQSILAIDPGDTEIALYNIKTLEMQMNYKFRYLLQTHGNSHHTGSTRQLFGKFDKLQVYTGQLNESGTMFQNQIARDLVPFTVGELSICFMKAPGHQFDNYIIAVTHVSPTSTKIPILFTGDTILVNSIGSVSDYPQMYNTIQMLRGFNSETLLFPGHKCQKENLLFAKTLEPDNTVINAKLEIDNLIPTTLLEERLANPYFRVQQLGKQLNEMDPIRCIKKLKSIQKKFFNV